MAETIGNGITRRVQKISRSSRSRRGAAVVLAATAMALTTSRLHAQTYTWDAGHTPASPSGGSGSWDLATSDWSNGSADNVWADTTGTTTTAVFAGTAGTVSQNANLGAAEVVFLTAGYTVSSGSNVLLLGTAGTTIDTSAIGSGTASLGNVDIGANAETWNVGSAALTFNGAVRDNAQSSTTLTVNGTGTTQLSGGLTLASGNFTARVTIAGSENINVPGLVQDGNTGGNFLTYDGTGTLSLSGTSNTFGTGTSESNLEVDSGVLAIASAGSLGSPSNPLVISNNSVNATFQGTGSSTIAIANPVTLAGGGGGAAVIGGSTPLNFTGSVTSTGSFEDVNVNNTALTTLSGNLYLSGAEASEGMVLGGTGNVLISGVVSDNALEGPGINSSNLTINGTGTVTLTNTGNNFSGNLAVDNGTLVVPSGTVPATTPIILGDNETGAVPIFQSTGTGTVSIANPVTLGGGGGSTSVIGGNTPLNFTGSVTGQGSSDDLNVNNTALTTFSGTLNLSGSLGSRRVLIGGTGNLLISAVVSDNALEGPGINPSTLAYLGTGTMTLTNVDNNFSGDLAVQNGTIAVTSDGALGVGSTLFFGPASGSTPAGAGIFQGVGPSTLTIAHPVVVDTNTTDDITLAGTTPLLFTNTVTFDTNSSTSNTVIVNDTGGVVWNSPVFLATGGTNRTTTFGGANNITINGVIATGAAGVTTKTNIVYSGTGTMTLSNANTYSGTTAIDSGVFDVTNTSGSATSTGTVTLNGGILASGTVGAIAGNVVAGTASHTIAPGGVGSVGVLTLGGLTTSTLTTLAFDLGTGSGTVTNGDNLILGSGTVSIASGTILTFGGTPVAGDDYQLIGDTSGNGSVVSQIPLANFALPTAPAGLSYSLALNSNFVDLDVVSTGPSTLTWNDASADNLWNTSSSNWNNGSSTTTYSNGSGVTFNDNNGGNYSVTLSTSVTPSSVTVNNGSGNYTISGSGSITGTAALTKTGSGNLTLSTANSFTGGTTVNQGTLVVGVNGALPAGAVSISNGTVQLGVSTGAATLTSLAITGNGTFDVNNDHLFIDYGSGTDPIASIAALLKTGFNGGHWNGAGGIVSTAAAANSSSYGLGYADSADTGNPASVASGNIEIKYTLLGDANLDGVVNGIDFGILAANFNKGVTGWDKGDFNYDNVVNGIDFGQLAANFNKGATGTDIGPGALSDPALVAFAQANGLMADVPEPATLGLVLLAAEAALFKRNRRSRSS